MAVATPDGAATVVRAPTSGGVLTRFGGVMREVARRPAGLFGLIVIGVLFVIVVAAPLVAPYSPYAQDIVHRLQKLGDEHRPVVAVWAVCRRHGLIPADRGAA